MELEKRLEEGFIPFDEWEELLSQYYNQIDPLCVNAIGVLHDGKKYWFRVVPEGMQLYLKYDCYNKTPHQSTI